MCDYDVSSIKLRLEDFYFRSYGNRDAWEDYARVVGGLLALHGKNLSNDLVEAIEYGDCFKVVEGCRAADQPLLQFLLDVHNDTTFFNVLSDLHNDAMGTYGGDLLDEQRAVIESGDARLISAALMAENNNDKPPYPIVVWSIGCTDDSGHMIMPGPTPPAPQPPGQP